MELISYLKNKKVKVDVLRGDNIEFYKHVQNIPNILQVTIQGKNTFKILNEYFDQLYKNTINSCLLKHNLKLSALLGKGSGTKVFLICDNINQCNKIVKIAFAKHLPVSQADNEIKLQNIAAKYNIAPKAYIHEICDDYYYIVMDWVEGKTLENFFDSKPSKELLKDVVKKIKIKVDKLNSLGITHNDLHFGNVMITSSYEPFIIDYGAAKFNDKKIKYEYKKWDFDILLEDWTDSEDDSENDSEDDSEDDSENDSENDSQDDSEEEETADGVSK